MPVQYASVVSPFIQYTGANGQEVVDAITSAGASVESHGEAGGVLSVLVDATAMWGPTEMNTGDWMELYSFNVLPDSIFQVHYALKS